MFAEKQRTVQSAGMEDGLIDLIVIRLLVRMCKQEAPGSTSLDGWEIMKSVTSPWDIDVDY